MTGNDTHSVECRVASGDADLALHHGIRLAVFVREQRVFEHSDHDSHDQAASTLHVLGLVDGKPAGTVRIFPLDPADPLGDWQGDRLAVLPEFRARMLGAPLVRFAVQTAAVLGGSRMIAHVQPANRTFFRRLGWRQIGEPELYVGIPHLPMDIELGMR
ncbi:MSMEG_0567/Sll0786 family nitrogen starvation N-acetyltransferase [Pseudonocardia sp. GCM10023141]|uniref:MSMEG_0567/Sll0786 family nitrogen starvation N-acetyltransferase n=1 Tax=Pseudonocardia sp. GCM10023141 TaxID=3252653 RepID=UPI00360A8290